MFAMQDIYTVLAIFLINRLVAMEDTAQISRETDCLETYIKKGIALGHFIYGRCLARGVVENTDHKEPIQCYAKVSSSMLNNSRPLNFTPKFSQVLGSCIVDSIQIRVM